MRLRRSRYDHAELNRVNVLATPTLKDPAQPCCVCTQIKKVVYKNRIRLKEFFVDFDKVCLTSQKQNLHSTARLLQSTICSAA